MEINLHKITIRKVFADYENSVEEGVACGIKTIK
jgi:hypothetical protein